MYGLTDTGILLMAAMYGTKDIGHVRHTQEQDGCAPGMMEEYIMKDIGKESEEGLYMSMAGIRGMSGIITRKSGERKSIDINMGFPKEGPGFPAGSANYGKDTCFRELRLTIKAIKVS